MSYIILSRHVGIMEALQSTMRSRLAVAPWPPIKATKELLARTPVSIQRNALFSPGQIAEAQVCTSLNVRCYRRIITPWPCPHVIELQRRIVMNETLFQ